jgi:hypothetical protein
MTVCFSFKEPGFIVTGTDVLGWNRVAKCNHTMKKFFANTKRIFVVLMSGSWLLEQSSDPDPRVLLVNDLDAIINKRDTMKVVSRKIFDLFKKSYSKPIILRLSFQVCGFDGKVPRIYSFFSNNYDAPDARYCMTGAPYILEYGKTEEFKNYINVLKRTIPERGIIQEYVRKLVIQAIEYENKKAISNGERPTTGRGINIFSVDPYGFYWPEPRYDSKDDLYQIEIL